VTFPVTYAVASATQESVCSVKSVAQSERVIMDTDPATEVSLEFVTNVHCTDYWLYCHLLLNSAI